MCSSYNNNHKSPNIKNLLTLAMLERLEKLGAVAVVDIYAQNVVGLRISIYVNKNDSEKIRYDLYDMNNKLLDNERQNVQRILFDINDYPYMMDDQIHLIKTLKKIDSDLSYKVRESGDNGITVYSGNENYVEFCYFSLWHSHYVDNKDRQFVMTSIILLNAEDHSKHKMAFDIIRYVSNVVYSAQYIKILNSDNIFDVNDIESTIPVKKNMNIPYSLF